MIDNHEKKDKKAKNKGKGKDKKASTEKIEEKPGYVTVDYSELPHLRPTNIEYDKFFLKDNIATIDQLSSTSIQLSPNSDLMRVGRLDEFSGLRIDQPSIESLKVAGSGIIVFPTTGPTLDKQFELEAEIDNLRKELAEKTDELNESKENKEKQASKIMEYEKKQKELLKKENLRHLLSRVNEEARKKLFESDDFKDLFATNEMCKVVVVSIDIRRSTDLMLKAREPKIYAEFITSLCKRLTNVIISHFGVFDKFTGDGILAFFPYFYSGPDATFYALKSADECHKAFNEHYKDYRHCFTTVLKDVGLGIGIDFGDAYLTTVNNELTLVGNPVVYACRFSGAEHGKTFLNQPIYEEVKSKYGDHCQLSETDIDLKHEGLAVAYMVNSINCEALEINPPDWDELIQAHKKKK